MNYCEFCDAVLALVTGRLTDCTEVKLMRVLKNNGIELVGISIRDKGKSVCPTIYLEEYFEQFQNGKTLDEIADLLIDVYMQNRDVDLGISVDSIRDFDKIKDRIIFRLVNYEKNERLLREIPHRKFLDLAQILCCVVKLEDETSSAFTVKNSHVSMWHTDENTLYEFACNNTPIIMGKRIERMENIIDGCVPCDTEMLVISNSCFMYGAGTLLYEDVLNEIAMHFNCNLYILPSSVHEVIAIKETGCDDVDALRDIVRSVNRLCLDDKEILSDNVYFYDKKSQRLTLA